MSSKASERELGMPGGVLGVTYSQGDPIMASNFTYSILIKRQSSTVPIQAHGQAVDYDINDILLLPKLGSQK